MKVTVDRAVVEQAMEYLERSVDNYPIGYALSRRSHEAAITTLRQALEAEQIVPSDYSNSHQPVQAEPVAWQEVGLSRAIDAKLKAKNTAPQRTWVGLTDEEIIDLLPMSDGSAESGATQVTLPSGLVCTEYYEIEAWSLPLVRQAIRAIEAKLKEKNK
jgi:hypothetical protein